MGLILLMNETLQRTSHSFIRLVFVAVVFAAMLLSNPRPLSHGLVGSVEVTDYNPYYQHGISSWYGKMFHGRKTATGDRFDMHKLTAAHRTLPIPSYAKVVDLDTKKEVVVLVNDRGPYKGNRVLDLSYGAAKKLGILDQGLARVQIIPLTGKVAKPQHVYD